MNKVMTRAQRRPGTRPPGRHDARRPGGAPPRTPGGSPARTTNGGRPPGSPRGTSRVRTAPADNRPPTAPALTSNISNTSSTSSTSSIPAAPIVPTASAAVPLAADVFADRLLAVLSGQRPVHWMLRHTSGRAYDDLARLAEHGPLRARGTRPVVRDIGYYEPRPGAVEAFARIGAGEQLRAMAFRLERGRDRRWRCTAVELGRRGVPRTAAG
ncbi:Rv3235 family protein [Streptomyces sp. MK5]|uniref:Rv3235 family protein n=1 Tax=Streptomyces sp. MK5 TaxID=3064253 RepID=UPI00274241D8|nr:Rv3235 family protein [Streptomyces sp. MK5]